MHGRVVLIVGVVASQLLVDVSVALTLQRSSSSNTSNVNQTSGNLSRGSTTNANQSSATDVKPAFVRRRRNITDIAGSKVTDMSHKREEWIRKHVRSKTTNNSSKTATNVSHGSVRHAPKAAIGNEMNATTDLHGNVSKVSVRNLTSVSLRPSARKIAPQSTSRSHRSARDVTNLTRRSTSNLTRSSTSKLTRSSTSTANLTNGSNRDVAIAKHDSANKMPNRTKSETSSTINRTVSPAINVSNATHNFTSTANVTDSSTRDVDIVMHDSANNAANMTKSEAGSTINRTVSPATNVRNATRNSTKDATNLQDVMFESGSTGVTVSKATGKVTSIDLPSQGASLDVKVGWRVIEINGEPFKKDLIYDFNGKSWEFRRMRIPELSKVKFEVPLNTTRRSTSKANASSVSTTTSSPTPKASLRRSTHRARDGLRVGDIVQAKVGKSFEGYYAAGDIGVVSDITYDQSDVFTPHAYGITWRNSKKQSWILRDGWQDWLINVGKLDVEALEYSAANDECSSMLGVRSSSIESPFISRFILHPGTHIIVEVGGHKGDAIAQYLKRFPKAHIFTFEPTHDYFNLLSQKYIGNERVHLLPFGLSDKDEPAVFNQHGWTSLNAELGVPPSLEDKKVYVQMRDVVLAFEEIVKQMGMPFDVLSLNCGGCEYKVLRRLADAGWLDPMPFVQLSWHTPPIANRLKKRCDIERMLRKSHFMSFHSMYGWQGWKHKRFLQYR